MENQEKTISLIEEGYFNWLCARVDRRGSPRYRPLLKDLYFKYEFYSILPNDQNRIMDGLQLRSTFAREEHIAVAIDQVLTRNCTLLEMLIALAERMDFQTYELGATNSREAKWFWTLIKNLDLSFYDEENAHRVKDMNGYKIERFLERKYAYNGEGGLFPLSRCTEDQREVEIWYQMHSYLQDKE